MLVFGLLVGNSAGNRLRRVEEGLGRRHVAVLAQHGVDEITIAVDGAIQVAPLASNLEVGFYLIGATPLFRLLPS
nr:hypothetical protein [Belnapia moabensis]